MNSLVTLALAATAMAMPAITTRQAQEFTVAFDIDGSSTYYNVVPTRNGTDPDTLILIGQPPTAPGTPGTLLSSSSSSSSR